MSRSGQLRASNDYLIRALLADPRFEVQPDGVIYRLNKRTWLPAGRRDKEGYVEIYYKGARLKAHRIIYAKFNGPLQSDLVVDHSNRNPGDNRPDNLELCGQRKNRLYVERRKDRECAIESSQSSFGAQSQAS